MDELTERVYEQVRRQFWYHRHLAPTPAVRLVQDLQADPGDLLQLSLRLEYALRVDIPEAEWPHWKTLADVVVTVRTALTHKGSSGPAWLSAPSLACGVTFKCPDCF